MEPVIRHAWASYVVQWAESFYDGNAIKKGIKRTAIKQYRCTRCGESKPVGVTPLPWWTDAGDGVVDCAVRTQS